MQKLWHFALSLLLLPALALGQRAEYDYIVVGSGPGGGPLAANLAKNGYSVLLLEAGDDLSANLNQQVAPWGGMASNDPAQRWDFFVKYHTDESITRRYTHLTWRQPNGRYYVGTRPPSGSTMLGVYYPRAGTLGGCSTHNALASALPSNSDWNIIAEITGDQSWRAENMRKYFVRLEKNNHVPRGTAGHGFDGYLDISLNPREILANQSQVVTVLQTVARMMGQDPNRIHDLVQRDLNNNDPDRDQQTGIFGFPAHMNPMGRRITASAPVLQVANATNPDGSKKYKLTVQTLSFVTKVLFSNDTATPTAIGVAFLRGRSMYSADPRYRAGTTGTPGEAYARKEVILAGGVFNTPQILKLSGIGPRAELQRFGIPVIKDLPGVGTNMQDNYEIGVISRASTNFVNTGPQCSFGAPNDPCLQMWRQGRGPYVRGPLDSIMFKSSNAALGERDLFMWGELGGFRGFWPSDATQENPGFDPPSTFGFSMAKIHPYNRNGTVTLRSADPRDTPEIQFRFFEDANADKDLEAMKEGIEFGRRIFDAVPRPLSPFTEADPCSSRNCDVKDWIKTQSWSHHATSSCSIGADNDPMAVLDSNFRVRGVEKLRVVDGSAFPRVPGGFPVLPTFVLSEKAADVILQAAASNN